MSAHGYEKSPYDYSADEYVRLLAQWPFRQKEKRIGIVGAGMSGLLAASLLKRAGHKVDIFEASTVAGGRVKTLRERFSGGHYAEAGAMRVPTTHRLTMHLIRKFRLKTLEFINTSRNGLFYINNKRCLVHEYEDHPDRFGFDLEKWEKGRTASALFEDCVLNYMTSKLGFKGFSFRKLYNDATAAERKRNKEVFQSIDRWSLRQFLAEEAYVTARAGDPDGVKKKLSKGGANFISSVLALEMSLPTSMASVIRIFANLNHVKSYKQILHGMDLLPKAFLEGEPNLEDSMFYNCRVVEIDGTRSRPTIIFENVITRHRDLRSYDLLIIAIPFSALRHVRMRGLASPSKRMALRQLHYDNACKVLLEFAKDDKWRGGTFWAGQGIIGGKSITDLPIRQTHYPNPKQNRNSIVLASYTWGDDSLRWTSLKPDDRIRFALRDMERLHGFHENSLQDTFIGGMSHSWAEQEFTGGAFVTLEPYQCGDSFFDAVWRPEGRLHYCGEHTSTRHGWIEGALESAIRVAMEVCTRIQLHPELDDNIVRN